MRRGFISSLIRLILLIIIGFGGIFFYDKVFNKKNSLVDNWKDKSNVIESRVPDDIRLKIDFIIGFFFLLMKTIKLMMI